MIGLLGTAWWAVSAVLSTLGTGLEFGWDGAVLAWDVGRITLVISGEVFEGVADFVWLAVSFRDAAAVFLLIAWPAFCVIALWPPPREEVVELTPAEE